MMKGLTEEQFVTQIVKREGKGRKTFKVSSSWGVYDAYKQLRKHKWLNIGRPLKEHEFYTIVREMNNLMAEELISNGTITFPARMGVLELRKFENTVRIVDGKLKVTNPIDWKATMKFWYEDEEAYGKKMLIRTNNKYKYKVLYKAFPANYINKGFYKFTLNRDIKRELKDRIDKGEINVIW